MSARVSSLTAELRSDTPYVATCRPRLSWIVEADEPGWLQAAVEIRMGDQIRRIASRHSNLVEWPFEPLADEASVAIRVTSEAGVTTGWSEELRLVPDVLPEDGIGAFLGLPAPTRHAHPFDVRGVFAATDVVRAVLRWTALGVADVRLNGQPCGDAVLAPGWPTYRHRLVYETYEVTDLIVEGANVLAATVAGCWYTEKYGFHGQGRCVFGDQPRFAARLDLTLADGTVQTVTSGNTWRVDGGGPVIDSGLYAGEHHDARRRRAGWDQPDYDDSAWVAAGVYGEPTPKPMSQVGPPVRRVSQVCVQEVITSPSGATILDFGQNLVGRLRLRVTGPAGQVITLRHAEVLEHGELGTRALRTAAATDTYVLAGAGIEEWEPQFTFHGFRYAQVDGWPGTLDPGDITAIVLHNDMIRTGHFITSHPLLQRLHENVVWGMRGNFLAVPTDCPQRDERLGWTGDIEIFAPTATRLFDVRGFLRNWLRDLAADQAADGANVPLVIPNVLAGPGPFSAPTAAWGDAATIVPWTLYERYGDLGILAEAYESMRCWVDTMLADTEGTDLWTGRMQLGDWLDPSAPPENPAAAKTSPDIVASAYLVRSTRIVAQAAQLLGRRDDAARYGAQAERSRAAFEYTFVTGNGRMVSDAHTAYAVALCFDLISQGEVRQRLADRLAELVREGGYHIATGFVGTPLVCDALSAHGHLAEAERLLLSTGCPSWLYPVTMGATTIWERWDSMLPDGSINPGEMTSFNHYALGAVADWLHRVVAGLAAAEPGYAKLEIAPQPLSRMDDARSELVTPYGPAAAGWRRYSEGLLVEAVVPPNVTAQVRLPDGSAPFEVGSGRYTWLVQEARQSLPGPVSIDSPAAEIIDDEEALAAVLDVLRERAPELAEGFTRRVTWGRRRPLALAFLFAPQDLLEAINTALVSLSSRPHRVDGKSSSDR